MRLRHPRDLKKFAEVDPDKAVDYLKERGWVEVPSSAPVEAISGEDAKWTPKWPKEQDVTQPVAAPPRPRGRPRK